MIPNSNTLTAPIEDTTYKNKTYNIKPMSNAESCLEGYVDGLEAVKQSVNIILNTERYKFLIYSWDYGVELIDLIGKPMPYVMSEIPRRINEALTQDERIERVENFEFEKVRDKLKVTFTVITNVGDFSAELNVNDFTNNTNIESLPHKHKEVKQGKFTYVYCENVKKSYCNDGITHYFPYSWLE